MTYIVWLLNLMIVAFGIGLVYLFYIVPTEFVFGAFGIMVFFYITARVVYGRWL